MLVLHPLYQSERLSAYTDRLIHAFTGKPHTLGGPGVDVDTLQRHREGLCRQLGIPTDKGLIIPQQVHSATNRLNTESDFSQTDAVLLIEPERPAMVLAADCVPVMLYDPSRHIGAVIHAGWRGTAQAISALTAQRMITEHQCAPETMIAVIGPNIGGCCYEVFPEVLAQVAQTLPGVDVARWTTLPANDISGVDAEHADASRHEVGTEQAPENPRKEHFRVGNPRIDLKQANRFQLEALGVSNIEVFSACTYCQNDRLFSYRRGENGRQGAIMMLR